MKYRIAIAESARTALRSMDARWRATLIQALRVHLEHEPKKLSRSRIKRLRGLRQPQYRLRVDEMRVFYDVNDAETRVEVLAFVLKSDAERWLQEQGVPEP